MAKHASSSLVQKHCQRLQGYEHLVIVLELWRMNKLALRTEALMSAHTTYCRS